MNTPTQLFNDPTHRHASFEAVASRDIFVIARMSIGTKLKLPDGQIVRGQFFMSTDVASSMILGALPLARNVSAIAASDLIPLITQVTAQTGKPRKGWLLSYSVWWSMYDLLQDESAALRFRGLQFQNDKLSFGRMPLPELTPKFLEKHFKQGVRTFFGVTLDQEGSLLSDDQQPTFFAAYQRALALKDQRN